MTDPQVPPEIRQAAASLLSQAGLGELKSITPLKGGRNNRVYRATSSSASGILKHYHQPPGATHDRFLAELGWYQFCERHGVGRLAALWGADAAVRCALFAEIPGRKPLHGEATADHVRQATEFFTDVNAHRSEEPADRLLAAADACFSIRDHRLRIEQRWERLRRVPVEDAVTQELHEWIGGAVTAVWSEVQNRLAAAYSPEEMNSVLPLSDRCLSPSDFGFHNSLVDADGRLWFLDFEYAGWDDPAKMACDFFWQVDVPAPRETLPILLDALRPWGQDVPRRVQAMFPLFGFKWCAIVLNEFLQDGSLRRQFAGGDQPRADNRSDQLRLAQRLLDDVQDQLGFVARDNDSAFSPREGRKNVAQDVSPGS